MDKELLIEKIKGLSRIFYEKPADEYDEYILETIKNLIDEYLAKNPEDTDARLRLVRLTYNPRWEDPKLLVKYLNEIFKYDPNNIYATLILAYTEDIWRGGITDRVFEKLNNLSSKNFEIISMIELAKAWYYEEKGNNDLYEKHLLSSISYCNKHVKNYKFLAYFYAKKEKRDKAIQFAKKAIHNIQVIFNEDYYSTTDIDITDVEKFINERFKGTYITESNLKSIYKLLK